MKQREVVMEKEFLNPFLSQKINSTFSNVHRVHRHCIFVCFDSTCFLLFFSFFGKESGEIRGHLNEFIQSKTQNLEKKAPHVL